MERIVRRARARAASSTPSSSSARTASTSSRSTRARRRTVPFLSKVTGRARWSSWRCGSRSARRCRSSAGPAACCQPPDVRRRQGARVLDGQAARRRPVGGPGDAVDRRGHRHPHGRTGGARQGAAGGVARSAAAGRGRCARAPLDRRPRQGAPAAPRPRARCRRVPVRGDHGHGRRAARDRAATVRLVSKVGRR